MIYQYEGKISLKGARQYLKAVILDKKLARDKEREEFAKRYIYTKNSSRIVIQGSNYTSNNSSRMNRQFTEEEIVKSNDLESYLLGW